ncbi:MULTISPECIES: hypothetical protein [unclassified Parabacteroides]|nr:MULTISPECIES: hypothetical protein [unclassified Parabacteroides]
MILFALLLYTISCRVSVDDAEIINQLPKLYPDYIDVTIPYNIAPLNFKLLDNAEKIYVKIEGKSGVLTQSGNKQISFSKSKWRSFLEANKGTSLLVTVYSLKESKWLQYKSFSLAVQSEPIDSHIVYRLIEPGYSMAYKHGIYQRNLETFEEKIIYHTDLNGGGCMNCHSFCSQDPEKMLFHIRGKNSGTYILDNKDIKKINTKTPYTLSNAVYPSWHPDGDIVAFSTNNTWQAFHTLKDERVTVFDYKSDILLYDIRKNELLTTPLIASDEFCETFPFFSSDGSKLYFMSCHTVDSLPKKYEEQVYSLCFIDYDVDTHAFGSQVDTLINAFTFGKGVAHPHASPDGKYILYSGVDHGNFSSWNKEADLYIYNFETIENYPLKEANSDCSESCNSWSSNSKWVAFSSRRDDGLYNRIYITYIDEKGNASKAFMLPQKDADYYPQLLKSYNLPEFIKGEMRMSPYFIEDAARTKKALDVQFNGSEKRSENIIHSIN